MRRLALALVLGTLVFAAGLAIAGCGDEEEATPTPDTITGTLTDTTDTTDTTETTETDTTETDTTETTETTDTGGGGGEGDPAAGKTVFTANCGSCHTLADAGTSGTIGPNLDDSQPSLDLVVDRVTNGAGVMPPFADQLSEQQINDVAAYVVQATS